MTKNSSSTPKVNRSTSALIAVLLAFGCRSGRRDTPCPAWANRQAAPHDGFATFRSADGIRENGLTGCVTVDRPQAADLEAIGGPQGLLDGITLLGPDEKFWTTHVIG